MEVRDKFIEKENLSKKMVKEISRGTNLAVGVLNGIVGNHLEDQESGLSIRMQFYVNEQPLTLDINEITKKYRTLNSKICILIHGLTNDETVWNFKGEKNQNYGTLLEKDLSITPFFVRYNTGLHISENGKQLSQLIAKLIENYPIEIDEINIIAHSMGGLVARSACYYAPLQGANWTEKLNKLFFLGTPHLGAPLEKFGNVLTNLLKSIPVSYTQLAGKIIDVRSAGIKDLRYGYLIDEDWKNHDPDELLKNHKKTIPLLENAEYFLITGTLTEDPNHLVSEWFGDTLVRKNSGKGKSKDNHHIPFNLDNHKMFAGIAHLPLAYTPQIYQQINNWLSQKTNNRKTNKTSNHIKAKDQISQNHFYTTNNSNDNKLKGAFSLALTTLNEGFESISYLQNNKNNISYRILEKIPVINIFSQQVEKIQAQIETLTLESSKKIIKQIKK